MDAEIQHSEIPRYPSADHIPSVGSHLGSDSSILSKDRPVTFFKYITTVHNDQQCAHITLDVLKNIQMLMVNNTQISYKMCNFNSSANMPQITDVPACFKQETPTAVARGSHQTSK